MPANLLEQCRKTDLNRTLSFQLAMKACKTLVSTSSDVLNTTCREDVSLDCKAATFATPIEALAHFVLQPDMMRDFQQEKRCRRTPKRCKEDNRNDKDTAMLQVDAFVNVVQA